MVSLPLATCDESASLAGAGWQVLWRMPSCLQLEMTILNGQAHKTLQCLRESIQFGFCLWGPISSSLLIIRASHPCIAPCLLAGIWMYFGCRHQACETPRYTLLNTSCRTSQIWLPVDSKCHSLETPGMHCTGVFTRLHHAL